MNYNYNDDYELFVHANKVQYKKIVQVKHNFRNIISDKDLDEGIMINFPFNNIYYSYKSLTNKIPLVRTFRRSGVIPYTVIEENGDRFKYFCLGIDSQYGTLTDFGGGVKKYETFAKAASRELEEESLGVFNFKSDKIYENSMAIYDTNMIIMFVNIKIDSINDSVIKFHKKYSKVNQSENKGIIWIHEDVFFNLVKSGKSIRFDDCVYPSIYKPVCDLLRSVSNINEII